VKNIFMCVVLFCTLAVASLGGTLATWSDSETSEDNTITTASLDLKVNGEDDQPWGNGVGEVVTIDCMIPCKTYGPYEVELWNAGVDCDDHPSHAYFHLKEYICSNVEPKINPRTGESTGYEAPDGSGLKPEPELVAEYGGVVTGDVESPGIGPEGDECSMGSHVELIITTTDVSPSDPGASVIRRDLLYKWLCNEVYLFDLLPCQPKTVYLWFHLRQDTEEQWGFNFIPNPGEAGYDLLHWEKFNDWPSWALMRDRVDFKIEFDLWLEDP